MSSTTATSFAAKFTAFLTTIISFLLSLPRLLLSALASLDIQRGTTHPPATITPTQEWTGLSIFSLLFLMWGLAYGLLDIMNYHIKVAIGVDRAHAAFLAMAYYFAYIPGALLIGGPMVERCGYRAAAVLGLVLLAGGDQIMAVGASQLSLNMMCLAHFVVGLGVSTLERTANAYTVECGDRVRAATRILIAQSAAAFGTIIAPILANAVIFDPSKSGIAPVPNPADPTRCLMPPPPPPSQAGDLNTVVSFYKLISYGIFGLAALLALLFFRTRLVIEPLVPASPKLSFPKWKLWKHPLASSKYARLWLGGAANFANLGCQVTVAQFFFEHMRVNACLSDTGAANMMMYAQILFLFGRLAAVGLIQVPAVPFLKRFAGVRSAFKPRWVLAVFVGLATVFTGVGIVAAGKAAMACAALIMFFEAPSFPMIFEMASAGLGDWTPVGESAVIVSICGGGLVPFVNGKLADLFGVSQAWGLATGLFGMVFSYVLMNCVVPSWRDAVDGAHGEGHSEDVELTAK
ncbi:hypothetical protein PMZ80_001424 [Knufia obscura]|uniref:Uncharacterized protein n=2 Tax=Knufia TaxID=430999 RepID=A0AAN8EI98_9EURO|nr:hypothetical protein PMZ80_001424 [Knufia obscura]KAK5956178.1 hypothetical protein OHC33_002752 [Knufia fluminis]